jgi:hypothetical protein
MSGPSASQAVPDPPRAHGQRERASTGARVKRTLPLLVEYFYVIAE